MVKLILPNSAPPGQESQKCLENSATDLVTSRKKLELSSPRANRKSLVLVTSRSAMVFSELGKMSFTIEFVYENYNF